MIRFYARMLAGLVVVSAMTAPAVGFADSSCSARVVRLSNALEQKQKQLDELQKKHDTFKLDLIKPVQMKSLCYSGADEYSKEKCEVLASNINRIATGPYLFSADCVLRVDNDYNSVCYGTRYTVETKTRYIADGVPSTQGVQAELEVVKERAE